MHSLTVHFTTLFATGILRSNSSDPSVSCAKTSTKKNKLTITRIVTITKQISFAVEVKRFLYEYILCEMSSV